MSKSDFAVTGKDVYATHKISDEIEWGVHIRETRLQGQQIELTPRPVEVPQIESYRRGRKRKRRKKRSAITATSSPEKVTLNRDACTQKQYINMLATPRVYAIQPEPNTLKPILTPCPPRFVQLANPKKQHLFNTWQDFQTTLPPKSIIELQRLLEKEEALGPKDASRYFKQLNRKKRLEKKLKVKKEKQTQLSKPRRNQVMKEISKLVESVINFLTKKSTSDVKYRHMMITEIIKQKLQDNNVIRPYKRSDNKNINAKTLHEVLDQLAIWLDSNIDVGDDSEDEAEVSEESTVSSITYINMLLSISDSMESELEEAEKGSVSTMHAIEEVLEEVYGLSETDMALFEKEIFEEQPSMDEEEVIEETEVAEEKETVADDSGYASDFGDEEDEEEEEFEEAQEEIAEEQSEEGDITVIEVTVEEEMGEKEEEEMEEDVLGSYFFDEEMRGKEGEIEVESIMEPIEAPEEVEPEAEISVSEEDVELMQRGLLDEFYEQQVKHLLISKEEISIMEEKPPSLILEGSLLELARKASISVEDHSPDAICCVSLKIWATWLFAVAENTQSWCQWIQRTIAQLRYYAQVLKGEVKTDDGRVKTLDQNEWVKFVNTIEKDIISWRQYNMHVQDLSDDIIENFANKRVICCPECLKSKLILSVESAHEVSEHLVEAIKTSAYWRRWLNTVLEETEKVTSVKLEALDSATDVAGTSAAAACSIYELVEYKCPETMEKKSSDSVFIIEEIEKDE